MMSAELTTAVVRKSVLTPAIATTVRAVKAIS